MLRRKKPRLRRADTGILGTVYRLGDGSRARRCPGEGMRARSANVMLVLGDVGEMREVAERPYDLYRLTGRQVVQDSLQRVPRRLVIVAMEADEDCRMLSTVSKTASPSCSRTVSPRIRPSNRMSSRSGRSFPEPSIISFISAICSVATIEAPLNA